MKITKVYTRRGDGGLTDLVGGVRIRKSDVRLEAYGTIDELNAHIGLLVSLLPKDYSERPMLVRIQNNLRRIDQINEELPEPQGFVLPGGSQAAAQAHVCRTVCRRAERCIDSLMENAVVGAEIVQYVNRLSDYLFVLAKKINFNNNVDEILWQNACR